MLKPIAIRAITGLSWRLSPGRIGTSLHRFSQVEDDSGWQMLRALDAVEDPEFQAKLFNNALEEMHHAALFKKIATEYSESPNTTPAPRRAAIFDPRRGLGEFEVYHFIGEADVYRQFLSYANAVPTESLRQTFIEIRGDEEGHQELARAELRNLFGSERVVRSYIRRIRLKRMWEAWSRLGRATIDLWSTLILSTTYFVVGLLFCRLCRRHMRLNISAPETGCTPPSQ
jgi:hypothetical protein